MPLLDHIRPEPNPPLTMERVEAVRRLYREGFTTARIIGLHPMSLGILYKCLDGDPFGPDGPRLEPIPRRRDVTGQRRRALRTDPVSLRNRLIRTAERQVREIEARLSLSDRSGPERERDIRMLAMSVKSLRDLQRLDADPAPAGAQRAGGRFAPARDPSSDTFPQEFAELRRQLAVRLAGLVARKEEKERERARSVIPEG